MIDAEAFAALNAPAAFRIVEIESATARCERYAAESSGRFATSCRVCASVLIRASKLSPSVKTMLGALMCLEIFQSLTGGLSSSPPAADSAPQAFPAQRHSAKERPRR